MRELAIAALMGILALSGICHGQDLPNLTGSVPPKLTEIKLGMPLSDVQKIFPDAKPVGSPTSVLFLLFAYFSPPELWDSVMLEFRQQKLESISLLILPKKEDSMVKAQQALKQVVDKNGDNSSKAIALTAEKKPRPIRWWIKDGFKIFAVGPALEVRNQESTVFAAEPSIQVSVTNVNKPMGDLMQIATPDEIQQLLFEALSEPKR